MLYHPSDTRASLDGYEGSLTAEQEDAVEGLRSASEHLDLKLVRGDYGPDLDGGDHAVEPLRLCLLRFLRGNAFSVGKALAQLEACVEYRLQHPTAELLAKSQQDVLGCDVESFDSFYPRWLMGYDRLGRPMLATRYGSLRLWDMAKITTVDRMAELHAREQELLLRVLRRRTRESGGGGEGKDKDHPGENDARNEAGYIVDTVVIVVDTAGLTLRHVTKEFIRLFKMRSEVDQLLFPEMLGKCFIVNTPSLFSYVWAMLSPLVDARTRSKIAIIAKPRDWKVALQEIADLDQISPEYGGEGKPQKDLPSLADALYAAGNTGGGRRGITRAFTVKPSTFAMPGDIVARGDGAAGLGALPRGTSTAGESKYEQDASLVETGGRVPENEAFRNRSRRREFAADDDVEGAEDSGRGGHGWLGSAWDTVGWMFGGWNGGAGASDGDDGGMRYKRDRDMSNATHDEEFFDALAELEHSLKNRRSPSFRAPRRPWGRNNSHRQENESQDDIELGRGSSPSEDATSGFWRRLWRGKSMSGNADLSRRHSGVPPSQRNRVAAALVSEGGGGSEDSGGMGVGGRKRSVVCSAFGRCFRPVSRRLERRSIDELVRWLFFANTVSVLLATAFVIAGASSLSTYWHSAVLGWQWGAITAVCLGSVLLLLALLGTVGARLRNRFTLLGFAALEGALALGMMLSGVWCLALAGGSATVSDLTWEAMHEGPNTSGTEEDFVNGARHKLVIIGVLSLVLSLFSVVGPCLLAAVLSGKIKDIEGAGARRNDERVFRQLRQSFQETNALCTIFVCVSTGYGGYALSFTIALGLAANVTSTYLMVAGGYLVLLAGVVGAWAAASSRLDAFRLHFGALLPAAALYASLTIVQLVSAGSSNRRVRQAWPDLHPEGENLAAVQARVRTMLLVGGVLSAVTFALVVAAAVGSWATRKSLLRVTRNVRHHHNGRPKLTRGEKLSICWALALATTSTFVDGSFAVFSAWLARDRDQAVWLVAFWRAMGRGDRRYLEGDTFTVATAIIVAAVIGPGALLYAWSVYCRRGFRFSVGILVCTASLHTQLLRYVTQPGSVEEESETGAGSGSKAVFIVASVILALLQVAGALGVLTYNVRRMAARVYAAEVQYKALLMQNERLSPDDVDAFAGPRKRNE